MTAWWMGWTTIGDRFADFPAYDAFTRDWLSECRRLLRKDGTIWVIGSYHNIFRLGAILQDLGFWILNDIVWRKSNPMPNFRGRRFTNAHETMIWAARGQGQPLPLQLPGHEGIERRRADAQRLADPVVHGATERLRNQHGLKLHPTQKPEALAAPVAAGQHVAGRHRAGPVPGDRHLGGCRQAAAPPLHRD